MFYMDCYKEENIAIIYYRKDLETIDVRDS